MKQMGLLLATLLPLVTAADDLRLTLTLDLASVHHSQHRDLVQLTQSVVESRLRAAGLSRSPIVVDGNKLIVVTDSSQDVDNRRAIIRRPGQFRVHLVHEQNANLVQELIRRPESFIVPTGFMQRQLVWHRDGQDQTETLFLPDLDVGLRSSHITRATVAEDAFGNWNVILNLNPDGNRRLLNLTQAVIGRRLAIVIDGVVACAPKILKTIATGELQISGGFTKAQADQLRPILLGGELPVPVRCE